MTNFNYCSLKVLQISWQSVLLNFNQSQAVKLTRESNKMELTVQEFIFENEGVIRLGAFIGILALLAIWEISSPKRKLLELRRFRWFSNIGLIVISSVLVRFIIPTAAVGVALYAEKHQLGFLNFFELSGIAQFLLAFVLMDLAIYFQHVMFHAIPALWRLHRMHTPTSSLTSPRPCASTLSRFYCRWESS